MRVAIINAGSGYRGQIGTVVGKAKRGMLRVKFDNPDYPASVFFAHEVKAI